MIPTELTPPTDAMLAAADAAIDDAIEQRDVSDLKVLGFGEIAVAIAWPTADPQVVLKRTMAYATRAKCERHLTDISDYVERLTEAGVAVLPTTTHVVERPDGRFSGYVAQPLVPKELLAETVIERDEPRADHPLLLALRAFAVKHITPRLSVDIQITNFAWDGEQLVLLDITSPFTYDENGDLDGLVPDEMLAIVPAFMRAPAMKEVRRVGELYRTLPGALSFVLVLLHRIDQSRWVPTVAAVFDEVLDEPLDLDQVQAEFERFKKTIPFIKRSARLQRWWITSVRRKRYDAFITDSFTGQLL